MSNKPSYTSEILDQTLLEIKKKRLEKVRVTYPIPSRISIKQTMDLLEEYLSEASEGVRPEIITYSIFETLRKELSYYSNVIYSKTTAPNSAMGRVADVECYKGKKVVHAIEVKDGKLTENDVEKTFRKAEKHEVTEIFFVAREGIKEDEKNKIKILTESKFKSGQNSYIMTPMKLATPHLSLLGEAGRKKFLETVEEVLEESNSPYEHRKKFSAPLKKI